MDETEELKVFVKIKKKNWVGGSGLGGWGQARCKREVKFL